MKFIKKSYRYYLFKHDFHPIFVSIFGVFLLVLSNIVFVVIFLSLYNFVNTNIIFVFIVFIHYIFVYFPAMLICMFTSVEVMWRFSGLYFLFGVDGEPFKERFKEWSKEAE